jgi:hypothetical protein
MEELSRSSAEQSVVRDQAFITTAIRKDKKGFVTMRFPDGSIRDLFVQDPEGIKSYIKTAEGDSVYKDRDERKRFKNRPITAFVLSNANPGSYTYDKTIAARIFSPENEKKEKLSVEEQLLRDITRTIEKGAN